MDWLSAFASDHPWIPLALSIYLIVVKAIVGIRDAFDKTPLTDDNWWERTITILGKTIGYLSGIRPKAPEGSKPVTGSASDASGVKVK